MFRSRRHPGPLSSKKGKGDGKSFVRFDGLHFVRTEEARKQYKEDEGFTGLVEVVVFEKSQEHLIGYQADDRWQYCCSEEWAKRTKCQLNHLYIQPQDQPAVAPQVTTPAQRTLLQGLLPRYIDLRVNSSAPQYHGVPWRAEVDFLNNDAQSNNIADNFIAINQTGVYIMWFVTCDAELAETRVFGESVWKNPRGYLPGSLQPILPFHASIALLYVIIGLTWLCLHLMHHSPALPQQHLVTLTLMLGMLESCMDYSDTARLNATGRPNFALQGGGIVVSAAYKSSLWLTVLLLARGIGSLRNSGYGRYPLVLAMVFFCADNTENFQKLHDSANNDAAPGNMTIRAIVGSLHAGFVVWTLLSFRITLRHLGGDSKGRGVRLQVYRILAGCLLVVSTACVTYLLFEAYIHATHPVYDKWQFEWMHLTFWKLSHMVLVGMLCTIWAPGDLISCYMTKSASEEPINDALWPSNSEKSAHVQVPLGTEGRSQVGFRKVA